MKKKILYAAAYILLQLTFSFRLQAQFNISWQLRNRAEFRSGQGAPLPEDASPAFFISQRTGLQASYNTQRLKFGLALRDVRVWGQDVSTINKISTQQNNGVMLHEAWAELLLSDSSVKQHALSLKIGRQELAYDDQRLIGNLDWLQQGRRHDAALLKYERGSWTLHGSFAFNQNKEAASGTIYNSEPPGNYAASTNGGAMYKSMEFLYAGKKLKNGSASFLFFADQFNKYNYDSVNNMDVKQFQKGAWTRMTTGAYFNNLFFDMLNINAGLYYQFGKNASGQQLNAWMSNVYVQYSINKKIAIGGGMDHTSGGTSGTTSHAFDPLYGTPHKFWGLMDYFYAGSGFGNGGLTDYYLKSKWKLADRYLLTADLHQFFSDSKITDPLHPGSTNSNFGQELDLVAVFNWRKDITLEGGYSHFFTTSLLSSPAVKNISNPQSGANWVYIMINIKPEYFFKF
ncbi:alginate export family protein [Agriterribacter humi]|uniref:alginate export family protein n=1 Tax=Agriterribacter humi TaxID=1104781 RepID=UPI001264EB12|nr:alginate export family protein [Agriterribacter humi]